MLVLSLISHLFPLINWVNNWELEDGLEATANEVGPDADWDSEVG